MLRRDEQRKTRSRRLSKLLRIFSIIRISNYLVKNARETKKNVEASGTIDDKPKEFVSRGRGRTRFAYTTVGSIQGDQRLGCGSSWTGAISFEF